MSDDQKLWFQADTSNESCDVCTVDETIVEEPIFAANDVPAEKVITTAAPSGQKRRSPYEFLIYAGLLSAFVALFVGLALRNEALLPGTPMTEDGFYALAVSRNIALGNGITIDGIQKTNGFQPLFVFLAAPLYLLCGADRLEGLRWVLLFHGAVAIATAIAIGLILHSLSRLLGIAAKKFEIIAFGAVLYLSSPPLVLHHFNGLETGLQVFLYCAIFLYILKMNQQTLASWCRLGILCGLLVLSRVDSAIFVVIISIWTLVALRVPLRQRLTRFFVLSATAALVSSPWWIYNVVEFGHLMPSSGTAQQAVEFSLQRFRTMLAHVSVLCMPWLAVQFPGQTIIKAGGFLALFTAAVLLVAKARRSRTCDAKSSQVCCRATLFLLPFAAHFTFLSVYYSVNFFSHYFYGRYMAPIGILPILAIALLLMYFKKLSAPAAALAVTALSVPSLVLIWSLYGEVSFDSQFNRQNQHSDYKHQIGLVQDYVPEDAAVSASQTGTFGYFRDHVINLDGKVNPEALHHKLQMPQYLASMGVLYFCDWEFHSRACLSQNPEDYGWTAIAERGEGDKRFVLWKRSE